MKIIVNSKEEKEKLLKESKYIHDITLTGKNMKEFNSDKASTLIHFYLKPDLIEVRK